MKFQPKLANRRTHRRLQRRQPLEEKLNFLKADKRFLLNIRREIFSKCWHENKSYARIKSHGKYGKHQTSHIWHYVLYHCSDNNHTFCIYVHDYPPTSHQLPTHQPTDPPTYPPTYLPTKPLFICLSLYLSICLSVFLSVDLSICLSICLFIYISTYQYGM